MYVALSDVLEIWRSKQYKEIMWKGTSKDSRVQTKSPGPAQPIPEAKAGMKASVDSHHL